METLFRSRWARMALALAAVVGGVWGFSPYLFKDIATSAYVNAELTPVVTPVAGVLSAPLPSEGSYLDRDRRLLLVTARTPDRSRLDDLDRQAALAASTVALMQSQLAELDAQDHSARARSGLYREAVLSRLDGRQRQARADLAQCQARLREQQDRLERVRKLAKSGFVSQAALESAEDTAQAARHGCDSAEASLDVVGAESRAASRGVFLSDVGNDAPFADQQRERLMLRRQELMDELVRAKSQQTQLEIQRVDERGRFAQSASYAAVLPAGHLVWNLAARPGSQVTQGQALMELADCDHRFVVVELPARKIEHLAVGDPARIRLLGSGAWIDGHVRRITGGAARQEPRLFAADTPRPGPRSFTVEVSLDGQAADARRSCDIGRPADVRFDRPLIPREGARVARLDSGGAF